MLGLPTQAEARKACAPRDVIIEKLAKRYGEAPQSVGLAANNQVIEVFASDENGTWTVLMTRADGISCLLASGTDFETLMVVPPGRPA
ncbi:hypothetical protein SAMN05421759_104177 [Roseivivax lentus]|uniref:Uncharacterized protein n=2 Tax=Roseivivax lentus TaxID=633194 RepID=A0A1N7MCB2_9RHOB|nr:hypothetical protein SAMN05421759_104177 [Roseivivax lentus]